ncbi:tol-pal system protein YbgF [Leucothrix arctica]|uniref:Cell division coordinator CpoB n=1 Tax=Leucothrix arctica TaxID=1481894 RepID=A0A317C7W2_9GAMM|nr:tol-pal system protein YbgF [Leucothrix arctica]PWQ94558.1 tol-pal system protein YbgF [Leucothrix arctica]
MLYILRKSLMSAGLLFVLVSSPAQAVTPDELFEVLQRIESLENEVRFLRGENEQLRYDIEDVKSTQKSTFIRIDDRMDDLMRSVSSSSSRMSAPVAPKVPLAPTKPAKKVVKPMLQQVSVPAVVKPVVKVAEDKKKAPKVQLVSKPVVKQVKPVAPLPIVKVLPATIKPVTPAKPEEQREYNIAFANIKPKPSQAIRQFRDFLKKYPKSPLAANSQYWLGEVMYSSRNYRGAIDEFVVVLEQYSDSSKAPDAAIKLGYSFYEMKNWVYARRTLQDVVRNFPKTQAAGLAEARLAKMKKENLY